MPPAPNYLDPQTLAAIESVELRARMVVEGLMTGRHRSPQQGVSVEFAQHRPYAAGDDTRFLDWKVFGKTDKLYLKQYRQETNLDLWLLLDASGSMGYTSLTADRPGWTARWTKWNHGCCVAAAMANVALRQQDRVGLTLFADTPRGGCRLSNASHHWKTIAQELQQARPLSPTPDPAPTSPPSKKNPSAGLAGLAEGGAGGTDVGGVLDRVMAQAARRSLVVLISDLFEDPARLESGLARLHHRQHDAMVLQVMDPAELEFGFRDLSEFAGLEGEGRLPVDPPALRRAYREVVDQHLRAVQAVARKFDYDYALLRTDQALGPPLSAFLARRAAMISKGAG